MEAQGYNLILIDGDNIAYKNFYANSRLSFNGHLTGALFGFLRSIISFYNQYSPNLIITWSDNNSYRKRIDPNYKATRNKEGLEEYYYQRRQIEKVLSSLGIIQVQFKNLEADDVISSIVRQSPNMSILIISEDKDLLQLVNQNVHQFKNSTYFTPEKVYLKYGVTPEQFPLFLSLIGDKSDNIPGIPGIGKKRASKILQNYPNILQLSFKDLGEIPDKYAEKVLKNRNLILKNLELIDLSKVPIRKPYENLLKINKNFKTVEAILYDHGIFTLLEDLRVIYGRKSSFS